MPHRGPGDPTKDSTSIFVRGNMPTTNIITGDRTGCDTIGMTFENTVDSSGPIGESSVVIGGICIAGTCAGLGTAGTISDTTVDSSGPIGESSVVIGGS